MPRTGERVEKKIGMCSRLNTQRTARITRVYSSRRVREPLRRSINGHLHVFPRPGTQKIASKGIVRFSMTSSLFPVAIERSATPVSYASQLAFSWPKTQHNLEEYPFVSTSQVTYHILKLRTAPADTPSASVRTERNARLR